MKIRNVIGGGQIFFCPGCKSTHAVNTGGPKWTYNGDPENPTFSPSILVTLELPKKTHVCHSFVNNGNIQFLGDCTHDLANQTVAIPEWPYEAGKYGGIDE